MNRTNGTGRGAFAAGPFHPTKPVPLLGGASELTLPRREFPEKIGTIVIGVLIALGAEQAVDWWHVQGEIRELHVIAPTGRRANLGFRGSERLRACW
jgi:hypothetical protein